jgi:N-acetyl sugar amidotransferase
MSVYNRCNYCVMDTSDIDINFDESGQCNHCKGYFDKVTSQLIPSNEQNQQLKKLVSEVKSSNIKGSYDCVVGVSGGVDSTYVALLAKDLGLRALLVHLDNGWNSEISVKNVRNITKSTNFDLYTHVIDWNEFRDIQLSLFKASVVDIELATDHAIKATLFKIASKFKVKFILNGGNVVTEAIMPQSWRHTKVDKSNIKDIHKKFGAIPIKTYPMSGIIRHQFYKYFSRIKTVQILNYYTFDREHVVSRIKAELGWIDYGGKHHESVFTRFYQAYILPKKFNIDKRLAHYSNLICAGQLSRDEALKNLREPVYDRTLLNQDLIFVTKKLGMSISEFETYLNKPGRSHYEFKSDDKMIDILLRFKQFFTFNR